MTKAPMTTTPTCQSSNMLDHVNSQPRAKGSPQVFDRPSEELLPPLSPDLSPPPSGIDRADIFTDPGPGIVALKGFAGTTAAEGLVEGFGERKDGEKKEEEDRNTEEVYRYAEEWADKTRPRENLGAEAELGMLDVEWKIHLSREIELLNQLAKEIEIEGPVKDFFQAMKGTWDRVVKVVRLKSIIEKLQDGSTEGKKLEENCFIVGVDVGIARKEVLHGLRVTLGPLDGLFGGYRESSNAAVTLDAGVCAALLRGAVGAVKTWKVEFEEKENEDEDGAREVDGDGVRQHEKMEYISPMRIFGMEPRFVSYVDVIREPEQSSKAVNSFECHRVPETVSNVVAADAEDKTDFVVQMFGSSSPGQKPQRLIKLSSEETNASANSVAPEEMENIRKKLVFKQIAGQFEPNKRSRQKSRRFTQLLDKGMDQDKAIATEEVKITEIEAMKYKLPTTNMDVIDQANSEMKSMLATSATPRVAEMIPDSAAFYSKQEIERLRQRVQGLTAVSERQMLQIESSNNYNPAVEFTSKSVDKLVDMVERLSYMKEQAGESMKDAKECAAALEKMVSNQEKQGGGDMAAFFQERFMKTSEGGYEFTKLRGYGAEEYRKLRGSVSFDEFTRLRRNGSVESRKLNGSGSSEEFTESRGDGSEQSRKMRGSGSWDFTKLSSGGTDEFVGEEAVPEQQAGWGCKLM